MSKRAINDKKISEKNKKEDSKREKNKLALEKEKPLNKDEDKSKLKTSFNVTEMIIIMVITLLFGSLIGGLVTYVRNDSICTTCGFLRKDLAEFSNVYDDIKDEYYKDVKDNELLEAAISGMIGYLDDPNTVYLNNDVSYKLSQELKGKYIGIGIEIIKENQIFKITKVTTGGTGNKAGLLIGDILIKVNNKDVNDMKLSEITKEIQSGREKSIVNITVNRNGEIKEMEIERQIITINSVVSTVKEKDNKKVGIITITNFAENTYLQFKDAYDKLKNDNVDFLILDVRNNGGGYLSAAKNIAKLFLNKEDIIYMVNTRGKIETIISEVDKYITLPTVIVANEHSASATEVLIAALTDNLKIKVVGTTTYGKGSIQKYRHLSSGAIVKYTAQEWLTPMKKSIDKIGIVPTIKVEDTQEFLMNPTFENDQKLQKAIDILING